MIPVIAFFTLHLMKYLATENKTIYVEKRKFALPEINESQIFSEVVDSVWVDKFRITHKTFK